MPSVSPTASPEATLPGAPARFPAQIKYIVGNEACERFSYYGLMGILEMYLVNQMSLGEEGATEVLHLFGMAVYFLPLLGGWLADRWFGRYWTILCISLFYCLGHGVIALYGTTRAGLFTGLALVAFGAGGIKPCVSAFVGDQFASSQQHLLMKVYNWFYWTINLGAAAAFFIIPWIHIQAGYRWAFGVPGIAMGLATLVFWSGTKYYVQKPPTRQTSRVRFLSVIVYALTHRKDKRPGEKFLDVSKKLFSQEEVAAVRAVLGILLIFATVPVFWALYNQVNSTWVLQGKSMTPFFFLNGETMQGAGAVLVMIWVPILTFVIYPWLERRGRQPTPVRRMAVGMLLAAIAFVLAGVLQTVLDRGSSLSIVWQLVPYIVLEAGEVTLSATSLEFAFAQAPPQFKSMMMSVYLLTIAGGHFFIAVFTGLNAHYVHAKGATEFYFYAGMMFLVFVAFLLCAYRYQKQNGGGKDSSVGLGETSNVV